MGIGVGKSSFGCYTAPNPDPRKYKILTEYAQGNCTIVIMEYPGCTTYKGKKISLYKTKDWENYVKKSNFIDPYFLENSTSPIARFPATKEGFDLAVKTAMLILV